MEERLTLNIEDDLDVLALGVVGLVGGDAAECRAVLTLGEGVCEYAIRLPQLGLLWFRYVVLVVRGGRDFLVPCEIGEN